MKKQYFLNANIIDPKNSIEEMGGLIVNEEGKLKLLVKKLIKIIFHHVKNILI